MYLKRIDISGFKSFPDPTTVIFDQGITAVVGPNGCGKTNILDAIRWVLGEQRPRLLRGGRMEEVIFSGTRQRPALNVAEVNLIIDNHSGRLPVSYAEVSLTRRLFRSGDSEYLINNTSCRLKDIYELLADTGIGSHSYSVIGQGMVDSLLSENPEDRRFLFEEAAGISKYKVCKKEAVNKLKATENDLLRVQDIENEVEKRVRELRVQVYRAKRYQKIADELAGIEWEQLAGEYRRCQQKLAEVTGQFNTAVATLGTHEAGLTHTETELEQVRLELNNAEEAAAELSENLNLAVSSAHQAETELVRDRERREATRATLERLSIEIADRAERDRRWTEELAPVRIQAEQLAAGRKDHETELADADARFKSEDAGLTEAKAARETLAEQLREQERVYGQYRADLSYQTELIETRSTEQAELGSALEETENECRAIEEALGRHQTQKDSLAKDRETVDLELAENEKKIAAAEEKIAGLTEQVRQSEKNINTRQAQAETLAGIVERGEGLGRGTQAVLKQKENFTGRVEAWGQQISIQPEKTKALDAVLAGMIGALWCETPEVAGQVQQALQKGEIGQTCLWDPSLPHAPAPERPAVNAAGFLGWLIDQCQIDQAIRPMADALLQSAMLADTPANARAIFESYTGKFPVVSLDGTAFVPPGVVYAGNGGTSVLGRTELLAQLQRDLESETERLKTLQNNLKVEETNRETLKTSAETLRAKKDRLTDELNSVEMEIGRAQTKKTEVERRLGELTERLQKSADGLIAAQDRKQATEQGRENWQETHEQLAARLKSADEELEEHETRHRAALNLLNEKRMAGVELSGRIERLTEEIKRKDEMLAQNLRTMEDRSREKEDAEAEIQRLAERITRQEHSWKELLAEKDRLSGRRNTALADLDEKKERFAAHEKKVRGRRKDRDESESVRHQWEMRRAEISGLNDQIVRRASDSFAKSREDLETTAGSLPPDKTISDDNILALKVKLERIGPVNLLALEEYEREKERLDFLQAQTDDLNQAKASLRKTIGELNRTAGERFMATFESARLNFQSVFTDLFQGGEADVKLINPDDPLESPIEIFARPRGKKALGIRHMSGGERALTAIAMLFGLYLVKPSPFCILDEVDAPLDDANTGRYLRLLERFKNNSQFVVITHNKLTMESADNLYGVTMEQPGISRLVSVRLNPEQPEDETLLVPVPRGNIEFATVEDDN